MGVFARNFRTWNPVHYNVGQGVKQKKEQDNPQVSFLLVHTIKRSISSEFLEEIPSCVKHRLYNYALDTYCS